jgi:hypothetical protein
MAGGGTGGHVYPGLAVLEALRGLGPVDVLYVGGQGSVEERLAARAGLPFAGIPAGGLHGLAPWRAARNLVKLALGSLPRCGWGAVAGRTSSSSPAGMPACRWRWRRGPCGCPFCSTCRTLSRGWRCGSSPVWPPASG